MDSALLLNTLTLKENAFLFAKVKGVRIRKLSFLLDNTWRKSKGGKRNSREGSLKTKKT